MDKRPVRQYDGPARRGRDVDGPIHRSFARFESNGRPCHMVGIRVATDATDSLSAAGKRWRWRAGDSRGSSRFLGLRSRAEIRIPAPEGVLPLLVEHAGSYLQEEMCSTLAPSHLLFLHHSLAHDLIDRRLDETGSDPFPVAIALPIIRHELLVALDVGV